MLGGNITLGRAVSLKLASLVQERAPHLVLHEVCLRGSVSAGEQFLNEPLWGLHHPLKDG